MAEAQAQPATIGPYKILDVLGAGGMGVVYHAQHTTTGDQVALKSVVPTASVALASIRREILALRSIQHPDVVRIVDEGVHEGLPWYAMELLQGSTLRSHIDARFSGTPARDAPAGLVPTVPSRRPASMHPVWSNAPPTGEVIKLIHRVACALSLLHAHGIVHRDLKPENVFVREGGEVVLVDFGIAVHFGDSREREFDGEGFTPIGTLEYMAPEVLQGRPADARADLYALGIILYECLTGRTPFHGESVKDLIMGHLNERPLPPSSLVAGVPHGLDRLVLRLLEKQPVDRLGFADDVAASLVELGAASPATAAPPERRAYVYRPDFVGRAGVMRRLGALVRGEATPARRVLLGGESGVGKTRLLRELAAEASHHGAVVVAQCLGAPSRAAGAAVAAPLHPFRAFLVSVADACRAGGAAETDRLLGPWARVLAAYEPSLADLPGVTAQDPPALAPLVARARVFTALRDTLFTYAGGRSLLVVVDDLQWADELTLGFLESLDQETLARHRTAVLGAYRTDEVTEVLRPLREGPDVVESTLERLGPTAVGKMISGMLALPDPPRAFTDVLLRESNGNPFLVTEYLRAAIDQGLLRRDRGGYWRIEAEGEAQALSAAFLLPPLSVHELMVRRIENLPPAALTLAQSAAVLGRELEGELLEATAQVRDAAALETLRVRQVLEEGNGGKLRFVHDRLRALAYDRIDAPARADLHRRAAAAIEKQHGAGAGRAAALPALAHHWARAGAHDHAAHYATLAGDRARDAYANGEAIAHYDAALEALRALATADPAGGEPWRNAARQVEERRADVMILVGQQRAARAVIDEALRDLASRHPVWRARLLCQHARTHEHEHEHDRALGCYSAAEAALGPRPEPPGPAPALPDRWPLPVPDESETAWWNQWVHLQVERVWAYYWRADVEAMTESVERARPVIEARGTPAQRARFFQALAHANLRRERYAVSGETVELARASLAAALLAGDETLLAYAHFVLAFQLIFSGALDEAHREMDHALSGAERTGDLATKVRCLTYLTTIHRLRGDARQTQALARRALEVAQTLSMDDYIGAAHANLGWVAFREGKTNEAARETDLALVHWKDQEPKYAYPFQWMARIHALAMALDRGDVAGALDHAGAILDPRQHLLPDAATCVLREAVSRGTRDDDTAEQLERSLSIIRSLGYG